MLVAQNSLGSVCPVPLTVRGTCEGAGAVEKYDATFCYPVSLERSQIEALQARRTHGCSVLYARGLTIAIQKNRVGKPVFTVDFFLGLQEWRPTNTQKHLVKEPAGRVGTPGGVAS